MSNKTEQNYTPSTEAIIKNMFKPTPACSEGSCPLKATEIAIYPVRYAINENPFLESITDKTDLSIDDWDKLADKKTHYSITKDSNFSQLPPLNTREYTLRQLRAGWLYTYTEEDGWQEWEVTPPTTIGQVTTFKKVDYAELDQRPATGETEYALYFKSKQQVYMAYSPVQWTQRIFAEIIENKTYSKMRLVDLAKFVNTMQLPHAEFIDSIGDNVADIFNDEADTTFCSSLVTNTSTEATDDGFTREQTISIPKMELIAKLKDPMSALYVALDDDLGIIGDLLLNTSYPIAAQELFEQENQRRTNIAQILYPMAGMAIDDFIPPAIAKDPITKYEYMRDLAKVDYLQKDNFASVIENTPVSTSGAPPWAHNDTRARDNAHAEIIKKWNAQLPLPQATIALPNGETKVVRWGEKLSEWQQTRLVRRNIDLADMFEHLRFRAEILKKLAHHISLTVSDLITWLDKLKIESITELYHDLEDEDQATELYQYANLVLAYIQYNQEGTEWTKQQLSQPSTLFGYSFFHFNKEIYQFFTKIGKIIAEQGDITVSEGKKLEDWGYIGVNRINEYLSVLDNGQLKASKHYATLSKPAQAAYEAFCRVVKTPLGNLYYEKMMKSFAHLLEANEATVASYAAVTTLTFSETNVIGINNKYVEQFKGWVNKLANLTNQRKELAKINEELGKKEQILKQRKKPYPEAEKRKDKQTINDNRQANKKLKKEIEIHRSQKPVGVVADEMKITTGTAEYFYVRSGQTEAFEIRLAALESRANKHAQTQSFLDSMKGKKLPMLMALWNIYNTVRDVKNAKGDAVFISNIHYTANAVGALWMAPLWAEYDKIKVAFKSEAVRKVKGLPKSASLSQIPVKNLVHAKFKYVNFGGTPKLKYIQVVEMMSRRVAIINVLLAVASSAEIVSIVDEVSYPSTQMERAGQIVKSLSLVATTGAGLAGVIGWLSSAGAGIAFTLGAGVSVTFLVAGIAYLAASIWIEYFHREGIALWADQCIWGNIQKWGDGADEQSQFDELAALYKQLLYPELKIRQTYKPTKNFSYRYAYETTGFWLQISFPEELDYCQVGLNSLVVHPDLYFNDHAYKDIYTDRIGTKGFWSDPNANSDTLLPSQLTSSDNYNQEDYIYSEEDKRFIYNVWIPYDGIKATSYLNLEIVYPFDITKDTIIGSSQASKKATYSFIYEMELFENLVLQHNPIDDKVITVERVKDEKERSTYINSGRFNASIKKASIIIGSPICLPQDLT